MENKKIPMITRLYSAITDFRIYPYIQKEGVQTAISYFFKLIFVVSLVLSIYITTKIYDTMSQVAVDYEQNIPNFMLESGIFTADKALYSTGNEMIIFDTEYKSEELDTVYAKELIGYESYALIGGDAINISANGQELDPIYFKNLKGTFTKESIYSDVFANVNSYAFKISLFITVCICVFFVQLEWKMLNLMVTVALVYIFNIVFGIMIKIIDAFKISMYVMTFPIIIELIAFAVAGKISESVAVIYQVLLSIYVFYALRAIKLDAIILEATKNGILKKVVKEETSSKDEINFEVENISKDDQKQEDNNDKNKED